MTEALAEIRRQLERREISKGEILNALHVIPGARVLLIGDFIIDLYTYCTALGKTSKTPTLSVKRGHTEKFWGGSGLFATNLLGLGAKVRLVTVCGPDWGAKYIAKGECDNLELHVVMDQNRPTTLKERFWVDGYKLLQVDNVDNTYVNDEVRCRVEAEVERLIDSCDFALLSDSRHGLMSIELIEFVKRICTARRKRLIVDTQVSTRRGNVDEYCNVDMICANETEARDCLRDERSDHEAIVDKLQKFTQVKRLIVKLGLNGLIGYDDREQRFKLPAIPVSDVKDPIGSGDAFLSAAALTYRPDIRVMASMFIAACSGSLAVTKMGTSPNTIDELRGFVEKTVNDIF